MANPHQRGDRASPGLVDDDEVTGLRWLHGENDHVPGLVVDGYGSTLVVKLYTSAWLAHLDDVVDALAEYVKPERVILRLARAVPATPGRADGDVIFGEAANGSVAFLENGHTMTADPVEGQKTGYFLDQRSNRRSFGDLAEAGHVLDVFCCHGGFSVHAAPLAPAPCSRPTCRPTPPNPPAGTSLPTPSMSTTRP